MAKPSVLATVPRGFLTAFPVPDVPSINPQQSGRLELAQWLTSPKNPLTARVFASRVWEHLFGTGIVLSTVDNGVKRDVPSIPNCSTTWRRTLSAMDGR